MLLPVGKAFVGNKVRNKVLDLRESARLRDYRVYTAWARHVSCLSS